MTMTQSTSHLLNALKVKPINRNDYLGESADLGWGRIFGGRLIAQALSAAQQSCPNDVVVHSLHCYFLKLGNVNRPVVYRVETLREGISHQSRRVLAKQAEDEIFHLTASFHKPLAGLNHQEQMPSVAAPETLENDSVMLKSYVESLPLRLQKRLPPIIEYRIHERQPLMIRPEHPVNFLTDEERSPNRRIWMKFKETTTENSLDQYLLMAYASDFSFLGVALQPHQLNTLNPRVSMASINHVIWFHSQPNMGNWNLFCAKSCRTSSGKALVNGTLFDRSGHMIASCAQEGIVRFRGKR